MYLGNDDVDFVVKRCLYVVMHMRQNYFRALLVTYKPHEATPRYATRQMFDSTNIIPAIRPEKYAIVPGCQTRSCPIFLPGVSTMVIVYTGA